MSGKRLFRRLVLAALTLTFLGLTTPIQAEELVELFPHATTIVNNTKTDLEAGLEYAPGNMRFKLVGKSPLSNPKDDHPLVQFDETTSDWRLATLIEYEFDWTGEAGPITYFQMKLEGEWGIKDYSYSPDAGDNKETVTRQSFASKLGVSWYFHEGISHGWQFMPQLFGRYDRSWKAADKVGVVIPGSSGQPSTVVDKVIKPPSVAPLTTVRLALPLYPGWNAPIAFGLSGAYGLSSKNEEWFGSDVQRVRLEGWAYFFPKEEDREEGSEASKTTNVRFGLAPFWDMRTKGEDNQEKHVYGMLVQLRVGVVPLEY